MRGIAADAQIRFYAQSNLRISGKKYKNEKLIITMLRIYNKFHEEAPQYKKVAFEK